MNGDVVDDTMRDLDPFSLPPKDLVLCPQPLAVQEVIDLDSVPGDCEREFQTTSSRGYF